MFFVYSDIYNYETLAELFRNCHNLEKVFAARVKLEDTILEPLLHCKKMKQLDISGSLVSPLLVNRMFEAWPDLRFIDFSSCFHRCHKPDVRYYLHQWTKHYQNLTMIRHSFNLWLQWKYPFSNYASKLIGVCTWNRCLNINNLSGLCSCCVMSLLVIFLIRHL